MTYQNYVLEQKNELEKLENNSSKVAAIVAIVLCVPVYLLVQNVIITIIVGAVLWVGLNSLLLFFHKRKINNYIWAYFYQCCVGNGVTDVSLHTDRERALEIARELNCESKVAGNIVKAYEVGKKLTPIPAEEIRAYYDELRKREELKKREEEERKRKYARVMNGNPLVKSVLGNGGADINSQSTYGSVKPAEPPQKSASVVGRAALGFFIAGPLGAQIGALSAIDKNMRNGQ